MNNLFSLPKGLDPRQWDVSYSSNTSKRVRSVIRNAFSVFGIYRGFMCNLISNLEQRLRVIIYLNPYTFHITLYDAAFFGMIFIGFTFILLLWLRESEPALQTVF